MQFNIISSFEGNNEDLCAVFKKMEDDDNVPRLNFSQPPF